MSVSIDETTIGDAEFVRLVAAQGAEVNERYGERVTGGPLADGTLALLARLDGTSVGSAAVEPLAEGVGELKRMYVAPVARGRGLGRQLLARAEELASSRGLRTLRLTTGVRQPEALSLYEAAGWSRVPCIGRARQDPGTVCFAKTLDSGAQTPSDPHL